MERVTDFIFLGSKITVDGDCSLEIKRCLLLGRKAMTNLDSILKSREITLPTKAHIVKSMVFPVVIYGCVSWSIKKAERWRIDVFELWCWRRLLRVPWTQDQTATAKSLQSCPTLCDPIDGSPPGSPIPGFLQARTLEWVAISFSSAWKWKVKVNLLSRVWLLATPWTAAYQAPPMGLSSLVIP